MQSPPKLFRIRKTEINSPRTKRVQLEMCIFNTRRLYNIIAHLHVYNERPKTNKKIYENNAFIQIRIDRRFFRTGPLFISMPFLCRNPNALA